MSQFGGPGGGGYGGPPGGGYGGPPGGGGGYGGPPGGGGYGAPPGAPPGGGGYGPPGGGGGYGPPGGGDPYGNQSGMGPPMGGNPYSPPTGGYDPMGGGPDPSLAKSKCTPPAIAMLVVLGIGFVLRIIHTLGAGVFGMSMAANMPNPGAAAGGLVTMILFTLFSFAVGGFGVFGLLKMMQGRSWGLSLAAVIVSMIPCIGPCCFFSVNTFVGIWALVVLNDSQVKAAFRD